MARKFYTIFILPHAHARFRKLHLSRNFVIVLVGLLGVLLTAGILSPHLLFRVSAQSAVVAELEAERQHLRDEKERFETTLAELRDPGEEVGRDRRYFEVTDEGREKLRLARDAYQQLWDGLEGALGPRS